MKLKKNVLTSIVFVILLSLLMSAFSFPINVFATESYDFANFTESDAIAFVEQCGIEIPEEFLYTEDISYFTQQLILQSYNTPDIPFGFNYEITQAYAEEIRLAVKSCMNFEATPAIASSTDYSLRFNKVKDVYGNWVTSGGYYNEKWGNYNCYAYAINRAEQPPFYVTKHQYRPGEICGDGLWGYNVSDVDGLALLVQNDLIDMGYSNVSLSYALPTVESSQELICVRTLGTYDYHFMRYDIETDAWYHKPNRTAVLKYNFTPTNNVPWYNECSDENGEYLTNLKYDSKIIFITYSKNQINVNMNASSVEYIEPYCDILCELNFANSGTCEISLNSAYSIKYEIYDKDFEIIEDGVGTTNDISANVTAGRYYLRMNFESTGVSGNVDISVHQHSYSYHNLSDTRHKKSCSCGEETTESHTAVPGSFGGPTGYGICMFCHGRVSMGTLLSVPEGLAHTDNGSYILPNGNIILVEEDVEAYLAGTLEFYYGEKE